MQVLRKIKWNELDHGYGVDGEYLMPWGNTKQPFPFCGAYCIARAGTVSEDHINEPIGQEELFIGISGKATIVMNEEKFEMEKGDVMFIPSGMHHWVENHNEEDFHFYALWWDKRHINAFTEEKELTNG